jgi:hypothetical protein
MGVLLLVRHGQGSLGTSNYDELSELGRRASCAPMTGWTSTTTWASWPRTAPATSGQRTALATRSPPPSRRSPAWPCSRRWTRRSAGGSRAATATRSRTAPSPPGLKP